MTTVFDAQGFKQTAVCNICDAPASVAWVGGSSRRTDDDNPVHMRISRRELVVTYSCEVHSEHVMDDLVEEFGTAVNAYTPDQLALAVTGSA